MIEDVPDHGESEAVDAAEAAALPRESDLLDGPGLFEGTDDLTTTLAADAVDLADGGLNDLATEDPGPDEVAVEQPVEAEGEESAEGKETAGHGVKGSDPVLVEQADRLAVRIQLEAGV